MRRNISASLKYFLNAGLLAGFLLAAGGQLFGQSQASALPDGDGKQLLAVACTQCHGLRPIVMMRDGAVGWKTMVQDMVLRGAQLLPPEADTVIQYLSKNFGPNSAPPKAGAQPEKPASLPAGPGKELVESRCTLCHGLEKVTGEKRSKEEWENTVKNMVERGMSATPEEIKTMTSYFTSQFGK